MKDDLQIFGTRAIIEAIHAKKEIDKVYLQKGLSNPLLSELNSLVKKEGIHSVYVPVEKLNRLTSQNHQGAVASIAPVKLRDFEELVTTVLDQKENPLFLILDGLSDARNFGAIIRTAACTGVDGIIIPKKGGAPVSADTVKTSAGGVFNVPITKVAHIKDAIYFLQGSGIQIVAATEKADQTIYETDLSKPTAIVMGSEDRGVSHGVLKLVDQQAKLPISGEIASLNVSVACGALVYEAVRQRLA